jgi:hypothetical protein
MKVRTPIALAFLVAVIAAPAAWPASPPDAFERAVNRHLATVPSALERADRHFATANAITARQPSPGLADGRSPDTIDAGLQAHAGIAQVVTGSGFGWGEFAIGAGSMLGLVALVGGVRIGARTMRSRSAHPSPA